MFQIADDPSSGSLVQCLAKNYKDDSIVSVDMDVIGVKAAYSEFPILLNHRAALVLSNFSLAFL